MQADLVEAGRRDQPFQVWHHCGHGRFDREHGYQLAFERGRAGTAAEGPWIGLPALSDTLRQCRSLCLVFLNVRLGASPDALGPPLAGLGTPAAIGHAVSVDDRVAAQFSREFWRSFGTLPVDCGCYGHGAAATHDGWVSLGRDVLLAAAAMLIYRQEVSRKSHHWVTHPSMPGSCRKGCSKLGLNKH